MFRNLKNLAVGAVGLATIVIGNSASAQLPLPFQVTPSSLSNCQNTNSCAGIAPFTANILNSNATSRVILNTSTGTFQEFGFIQIGQFLDQNGVQINGTGLANNYNLYATFNATGTFTTSGGGTQLNGNFSTLNLALFADPQTGSAGGAPPPANGGTTNLGAYAAYLVQSGVSNNVPNTGLITGNADDILLGNGTIPGTGASATAAISFTAAAQGNAASGSFGGTLTWALTSAGSGFFTEPVPFYNLILAQETPINGQFALVSGSDQEIFLQTGGPERFLEVVPEPATLAIFGCGLLGLGWAIRRRRSAS
jgi:hypothetical protein